MQNYKFKLMKKVIIDQEIKKKIPQTQIGYIQSEVKFAEENSDLWQAIEEEISRIEKTDISQIKDIPQIKFSREAYKKLGKDPSRYRLSAEALYRRIVQGKGLYKINNLVDTINLASISTGFSIGGYDFDKISGDEIRFSVGKANEPYEAIGRGQLNIENLPVFRDALGAFGSPTSDSTRTMITKQTRNLLLLVINFGTDRDFYQDLEKISGLLEKFCGAEKTLIKIFD